MHVNKEIDARHLIKLLIYISIEIEFLSVKLETKGTKIYDLMQF